MSRGSTAALAAGREFDALIAARLFAWTMERAETPKLGFDATMLVWARGQESMPPQKYSWCHDLPMRAASIPTNTEALPHYSTSIAAAWQVVERLIALGWTVGLEQWNTVQGKQWRCDLHRNAPYGVADGLAVTAPLAICRAALTAITGGAS